MRSPALRRARRVAAELSHARRSALRRPARLSILDRTRPRALRFNRLMRRSCPILRRSPRSSNRSSATASCNRCSFRQREGTHRLIAGRKRLSAAVAAGLRDVPCVVFDVDDDGGGEVGGRVERHHERAFALGGCGHERSVTARRGPTSPNRSPRSRRARISCRDRRRSFRGRWPEISFVRKCGVRRVCSWRHESCDGNCRSRAAPFRSSP